MTQAPELTLRQMQRESSARTSAALSSANSVVRAKDSEPRLKVLLSVPKFGVASSRKMRAKSGFF
jgi:hypothetical protein